MINFLLALGVYVFLFIVMFISVRYGYRVGVHRSQHDTPDNAFGVVKVAEGTVFALLGLLVAFTFSGAYDRFEDRKLKIIEEINAIQMTYHRIDLLNPSVQKDMRDIIQEYVRYRIDTYQKLTEFKGIWDAIDQTEAKEDRVWSTAMEALKTTNNSDATLLFVPALDSMLEIANTRILLTRIHPPIPIFVLLIGLAALSSFLVGYGMAKNKKFNLLYTICFVGITAFTLYVIVDLEFPRLGMIRVDSVDNFLTETLTDLNH